MDSAQLSPLPGVSGTLFPSRFLAAMSTTFAVDDREAAAMERTRRDLLRWWAEAERHCGPATGLRALFDYVAMPLAALLGFRARDAEFENRVATVRLDAARQALTLVLLPWAARPSRLWRPLASHHDSDWSLIVAPPFVSVVHLRGHSTRRSVDFRLPEALDSRSFPAFLTACRAGTELDALVSEASRFQAAVRADLQAGVVDALSALRPVLPVTPRDDDALSEALTIVYRVLFLLFAESRSLVPQHHPRYGPAYSVTSLCRDALQDTCETPSAWDGLAAVTRLSRSGCDSEHLIVRPFNGRLFARSAAPALESSSTRRFSRRVRDRDRALSQALVLLGTRPGPGGREEITYADLGVEQLGAVYERILDLDPAAIDALGDATRSADRAPSTRAHSARRKDSGTFYTPQPLAELIVRRTLAPLVRDATAEDILALRVLDPAMGSGAFLVAACRYLSHAYELALVNEGGCAETDVDPDMRANIRRTVAARCLCGVDVNPVAVQLARLSLWLTTLARDKPLSFLDHKLRTGDSLVGAVPEDLWREPARRQRRAGSEGGLFGSTEFDAAVRDLVRPLRLLHDGDDNTVKDVHERERLWAGITRLDSIARWRAACDLWCARWFWREGRSPSPAESRAVIDALVRGDRTLAAAQLEPWLKQSAQVAKDGRFFHWPLEFADVFYRADGSRPLRPGFDAVIGNPPWDVVRTDRHQLHSFVRESGLFRGSTRGHLNLYQPFVELALRLTRPGGRLGMVLPWSAATDDGAAPLRQRLFSQSNVETLAGLDNAQGIFPIHRGLRFLVLSATNGSRTHELRLRCGVRSLDEIDALPSIELDEDHADGLHRLTIDDMKRTSGPLLRIPDVRRPELFARLVDCRRKMPALGDSAGWAARFGRELNATDDRKLFSNKGLPVLDGKHISPFRTVVEASERRIEPAAARTALPDLRFTHARLAYRDVSGVGNRCAVIASIVPANVVTTHTLFCLRNALPLEQQHFLCGVLNSDVIDGFVRMLMGSHVTTSLMESLPAPPWTGSASQQRIAAIATTLASHPDPASENWQQLRAESSAMVDAEFA